MFPKSFVTLRRNKSNGYEVQRIRKRYCFYYGYWNNGFGDSTSASASDDKGGICPAMIVYKYEISRQCYDAIYEFYYLVALKYRHTYFWRINAQKHRWCHRFYVSDWTYASSTATYHHAMVWSQHGQYRNLVLCIRYRGWYHHHCRCMSCTKHARRITP